jgi:small GTP-binding protein
MEKVQKIAVFGLENAGKTSLLSTFGGNLGIEELSALEPTRGVKRNHIGTKDSHFLIWDFGGQEDHRSQYLEQPEDYFLKLDLLIYVIDIQASKKYKESLRYFEKILETLKILNQQPHLLIFLHKVDPEIKNEKFIQNNVKKLRVSLEQKIQSQNFHYEIFLTSIYSSFTKQPKFLRLVKELVEGNLLHKGALERKLQRIGSILESTVSAIVELSSRLIDIENKINVKSQITTKKQDSTSRNLMNDFISQLNNIFIKKEES